ncbi:MAG TPA: DUF1214 domain-containing protein [Myxococcales bacterium]|nr:DUF1214 domain-containing protein [Myxococcales bacterium]
MLRLLPFLIVLTLSSSWVSTAVADEEQSAALPYSELQSVIAFDQLMGKLQELRKAILTDARSEREAAEGMRFILRTLAMSQDVTGDGYAPAPHFARMDTGRRKVGGDNPDGEYHTLAWDGERDYKITGNIGTVDHLSFSVLAMQRTGRSQSLGYANERTLGADADGNFTLWLSTEKPQAPGAWIQTRPGFGSVLVRQYFGDREEEKAAEFQVEVVGRERFDPLPASTDAEVARAIHGTRFAVQGIGLLHRYVSPSIDSPPNRFLRRNSDDFGADISSPDNLYLISTYAIGPDEGLLVEVEPLDVRFWNFAIENPWHESVDYNQRRTSLTHDNVQPDPDGMVRFLVAQEPTAHANSLETAGHERGFMTFRWVGERDTEAPLPKVTRLPLAEAVARAAALARGPEPGSDP